MTDAFVDAWEALHELPVPGDAVSRVRRRAAAREVASTRLPRVIVPLTRHEDFDRLRVNVYALVAPDLVKWR